MKTEWHVAASAIVFDGEMSVLALLELGHSCDRTEGSLEVELPLPR